MRYRVTVQILLIVISVIIVFTVVKPKLSVIQTAQDSVSQYEDAVKSAGEYNQRAQALVNQVKSISDTDLKILNRFIPEEIDNTKVAGDIRNIVENSGLLLLDVGTNDEEVVTVTVGGVEVVGQENFGRDLLGEAENSLVSAKFTVEAAGNYGEFVNMLKGLENNVYPLVINKLSFAAQEDSDLLVFSLELETYSLK